MTTELKATVKGRFVGGGLFEPKTNEQNGSIKYNACTVLEEGEEAKIDKIVKAAIKEKWGDKPPKNLQVWGAMLGDDEEFEHSYDRYFINPKANHNPSRPKQKPKTLIKRDGVLEEVTEEDDIIYPGCYVAVAVNAYGYPGDRAKGIKPGVSLAFSAVMFMKDGERLTNSINAEEAFDGIDSELDADDEWDDI